MPVLQMDPSERRIIPAADCLVREGAMKPKPIDDYFAEGLQARGDGKHSHDNPHCTHLATPSPPMNCESRGS